MMGQIIGRYIAECFMLMVGVCFCMQKKMHQVWWLFMGLGVSVLGVCLRFIGEYSNHMLISIIACVAVFLCLEEKTFANIIKLTIIRLGYEGLSILLLLYRYLYSIIGDFPIRESMEVVIIRYLIATGVMSFIGIFYHKRQKTLVNIICLILLICSFLYMVFIVGLAYFVLLNEVEQRGERMLCEQMIVGGMIQIIFLLLVFVVMANAEKQLREAREQSEKMRLAERNYYEMLLEQEDDTRKFRHDVGKHFMVLKRMLDAQEIARTQEYLTQLTNDAEKLTYTYRTGKRITDIITNHWLNKLEDDVEIKVFGRLLTDNIDDKDFCIIYGNLLENAVEEVQRCGENHPRFVYITLEEKNKIVHVKIENVAFGNAQAGRTKKDDKRNHGIGLKNVENAVKRMQGSICMELGAGKCQVDVYIPQKHIVRERFDQL